MKHISITASQINAWMHKHHADTAADLARQTVEQKAMHAILWEVDLAEVVQDPARSTYNPGAAPPAGLPASTSAFDMQPLGTETTRYRVWLSAAMAMDGDEPLINTRIEILNSESESFAQPLFLTTSAKIGVNAENPQAVVLHQGAVEITVDRVMPEDLKLTNETVTMFINLEMPIGLALARNVSTESYDVDFSQVLSAEDGQSF